jgi:hypothetical protein
MFGKSKGGYLRGGKHRPGLSPMFYASFGTTEVVPFHVADF